MQRSWTVDKISLYAEYSAGVESVEKDENVTIQSVSYIYVELREGGPYGTLLAYGTVYIGYLDWYDVQLSSQVTLSPDKWYYIVAYSPYDSWNIYYHYDGQPNNDGPAGINRFGYWKSLAVDLLTRYHATYTIDSTRIQQLKTLAQTYEPILMYYDDEPYYPCDFYFDKDMDISNNKENYDNRELHPEYDVRYRVFIHVEEYVFHDDLGMGPMIAIEYWYYYVNDPKHLHDWELHCIIFLDQCTEEVVLVGRAWHDWIFYEDPSKPTWIEDTHPVVYIDYDHAADFEPSPGQNKALNYRDVLEIYVFDTSPCISEYDHAWGTFCNIINWEGYHVTWPSDEGGWADSEHGPDYWWPKYYNKIAPWHRYTWDEPTTGNPST